MNFENMLLIALPRLFLQSVLLYIMVTTSRADLCVPSGNVLHVQVDLFSSTLGNYTFRECGDQINPILGLRRGQTYTFDQYDRTNYYHPLGITGTSNTFRSGDQVLDKGIYERRFFEPASLWSAYQEMSITITIDENTKTGTTYLYYCIIHHSMDGTIRIIDGDADDDVTEKTMNSVVSGSTSATTTQESYSIFVDDRSEFDKRCGTYGLGQFQLPNPLCPDRFVCGTDAVTDELRLFSSCLEAANCAMVSGMTTGVKATDDSALFIHQMIPHHENAVNTAKTLLKTGNLLCPDLTDKSNPDCILESILYGIIAGQNHQIQLMRQFLSDYRYPQNDNCDIFVETINKKEQVTPKNPSMSSAPPLSWGLSLGLVCAGLACIMIQ